MGESSAEQDAKETSAEADVKPRNQPISPSDIGSPVAESKDSSISQETFDSSSRPLTRDREAGRASEMLGETKSRLPKSRKHCFTARKNVKFKKSGQNAHDGMNRGKDSPSSSAGESLSWRLPNQAERNSGAEILGRKIRVWWDGDQRWFVGVVVDHDCDPSAMDGHGNVGPTFTVQYEDGCFDENLEVNDTGTKIVRSCPGPF